MSDDSDDFAELDDSALLGRRAEMRAKLERLPPTSSAHVALSALYDISTEVVNDRARKAWSNGIQGARMANSPVTVEATISHLPARAAKMAAVEILLTDPESLHDDVLESCLYILRERLKETA